MELGLLLVELFVIQVFLYAQRRPDSELGGEMWVLRR
jgi:hypothetical protein